MDGIQDLAVVLLVATANVVLPLVGIRAWRYLGERLSASTMQRIGEAAARAAGAIAVEIARTPANAPGATGARNSAVNAAAAVLQITMRDALAEMGGTPAQVRALVQGELGKLLAPALVSPPLPAQVQAPAPSVELSAASRT